MVNIKNILNNKRFLIILGAGCVVVLIFILITNKSTQPQPTQTPTTQPAPVQIYDYPTDSLPNPSIRNIERISLIIQSPLLVFEPEQLPEKLPIYEYKKPEILTEENVLLLANSFKLGKLKNIDSPVQGKVYIAGNENGSLIAEVDNNTISISLKKKEAETSIEIADTKVVIENARKFVNLLGIDINRYQNVKYAYTVDSQQGTQIVDIPENAEGVQVLFKASTPNNYPLIDKNFDLETNTITVNLNLAGDVLGANLELYGEIKESNKTVNIKNKDIVVDELKNQRAMPFNLEAIIKEGTVSATARKVTLSYVEENNELRPAYVIIGNTNLSQPTRMRGTAEVQFILDAEQK
jgi:hypothetical protein